ncbi:Rieske (2Fe-2S) protein [Mesobacterium pallidum]|uniref:Rieske (2Fe-2S) protein n=1 Tax=Mesobacterium pallidum TaxID=2872037 RepID=UPI001EE1EC33|nr:Rieske 2Fe-2S domain-containing protein [Mesobacterium pallidum]
MTAPRALCRLDEIADGGAVGLCPDARGRATVVAVRRGEVVHAWRNLCPHQDRVRLGWRRDAFMNGEGTHLMCAAHGALFRPEDGICTSGPCIGDALNRVHVTVENGVVLGQPEDLPAEAVA